MDSKDSENRKNKRWDAIAEMIKERCNTGDEVAIEGIREFQLFHGLKLISTTRLMSHYFDICFCNSTQEYLILDDEFQVHKYSIKGNVTSSCFTFSSRMNFKKMIWCDDIERIICYALNQDNIWVFDSQFKLIQNLKTDFRIINVFYFSENHELIVIGPTIVAKYSMWLLKNFIDSYEVIPVMDLNSESFWSIQCSSIIQNDSDPLRLVVSYVSKIYVVSLTMDHELIDNDAIFLAQRTSTSLSFITALYYHPMSQWIISGDQQGVVSAWTIDLELVFTCLDGHKGLVTMIISHPSICGFITTAEDNVLQVWSCNLRDKLESFTNLGVVSSMAINPSAYSLATLGSSLNFFMMQHLYTFYIPLTSPPMILSYLNPFVKPNSILVCSVDNKISILSKKKQINSLDLPTNPPLTSFCYSTITNNLYTVLRNSREIFVSNVDKSPMDIDETWSTERIIVTCIAVYDYYERIDGPDKLGIINSTRARLIIGTSEGDLVTIHEVFGKRERSFQAHKGPVVKLCTSEKANIVVSIGEDFAVKIWRAFPTSSIFVALKHSIYYETLITDISIMGFTICMVSSTEETELHQLFTYNTNDRVKYDPYPLKNHSKRILSLSTSESLLICATSSEDTTVRIWDEQNILIKLLELNVRAKELIFSSEKGDIIFNTGKHLYHLPYENYLPPTYRIQIKMIDEMKTDDEDNYDGADDSETVHLSSSIPLGSLDPQSNAPRLDLSLQKQKIMQLTRRDEDIIRIRDGLVQPKKISVKKRSLMTADEWNKYIKELTDAVNPDDKSKIKHNIFPLIEKYSKIKLTYNKDVFPNHERNAAGVKPVFLTGFQPNSSIIKHYKEVKKPPVVTTPSEKRTFKYKYIYPPEFYKAEDGKSDSKSETNS